MSNPLNIIQRVNHSINQRVEQERKNSIGISVALLMFSTGIASINAAMAVQGKISMVILMTSIVLAMATAVLAISQLSFKAITWFFIASVLINSILLIYQIAIALS
jgi:hypothetical protein